jgi:hypothetical protein
MKKQLVIIGITLFLLAIGLSGCTSQQEVPKYKIIGTWNNINQFGNETTYTFYGNGSVHATVYRPGMLFPDDLWYQYSIAGDEIIIDKYTYEFKFSVDNQQLTLGDKVYNRQ